MMSFILLKTAVFDDTFITGTEGLPVGVPNPVVNKIMFAPEPERQIAFQHLTNWSWLP